MRSPDIINNYNKDKSVQPTKPYAGEKAVPYKNTEVSEIKPFNNAYVPTLRQQPDIPQINSDRKAQLQNGE
jgi:hypothetical protein